MTASVDLDATVERVWAGITDWVGQGAWMPMTAVEVQAGDGGLGTRLLARTGRGRLAIVDPMTIDVWDPPHRCEVQHHGRIVRGRGIFTVDPLPGNRARLTWTEDVEGGLARLTAPLTRQGLLVALRRFGRTLR